MKDLLKNKGFKNFLIKIVLLIGIGLTIMLLITFIFRHTTLFQKYLDIPKNFTLEGDSTRTRLINACLFGVIAFIVICYNKILNIKYFKFKKSQYIFMLLSLLLIVAQYAYKYIIHENLDYFLQLPHLWGSIKIIIIILFVITLWLAVFGWQFTKYMLEEFKKEIIISILIIIAFFFLTIFVQSLWPIFSNSVTKILYNLFKIFYSNVVFKPQTVGAGGPLLGVEGFKAVVGEPCSGIDSFLLFTSLYTLIVILDYKRIRKRPMIITYVLGAIGMFATNILRVFLLFMVGVHISATFAIGLFHTNIGWILFIVYFFIFWSVASKYVYKKKKS